jgi:indole-3-glycerol phosphate synthase
MSILEEIFSHKRKEVADSRRKISITELESKVDSIPLQSDFKQALRNGAKPGVRLIAEIKCKSPSKGVLSEDFDAHELADIYAENGAAAISVLTDNKYFGGRLEVLRSVHDRSLGLPLLRKDFIFDRYQLLEARAAGASAALLIVAALDNLQLSNLILECQTLALVALVEVHNKSELDRALEANAEVIGINNRNLHDFSVDITTCLRLAGLCPPEVVVVAESGISSIEDINILKEANIDAVLVGEALVTAKDVASKVRNLAGLGRE